MGKVITVEQYKAGATEKNFSHTIIDAACLLGYPRELIYHTYDSRRSQAGFPDLVMIKPSTGRLVVAEIKAEGRKLTDAQKTWQEGFKAVTSLYVGVWTPSCWHELINELGK